MGPTDHSLSIVCETRSDEMGHQQDSPTNTVPKSHGGGGQFSQLTLLDPQLAALLVNTPDLTPCTGGHTCSETSQRPGSSLADITSRGGAPRLRTAGGPQGDTWAVEKGDHREGRREALGTGSTKLRTAQAAWAGGVPWLWRHTEVV